MEVNAVIYKQGKNLVYINGQVGNTKYLGKGTCLKRAKSNLKKLIKNDIGKTDLKIYYNNARQGR